MTEKKVSLTKKDRLSVMLRSQFLQGSWNYERMQNGGWAFSLIPALKKLYPNPEDSQYYTLDGDDDKFEIVGNQLKVK